MLWLRTKPRIDVCFWSGAKQNDYHTTKTWLRETLSGLLGHGTVCCSFGRVLSWLLSNRLDGLKWK